MIFRLISTFFIIIFNFVYSIEQFPPLNISPTYLNAKDNNLVNYFKNQSNQADFIPIRSDFRNLNQNRIELSSSEVAHLLRRTTFGPTLEEIESVSNFEVEDVLNLIFQKPPKPIPDFDWIYHAEHPDFSQLTGVQKDSIRDGWDLHFTALQSWWLNLMDNSSLNITEMMVLFWHDHFATSAQVIKFTPSMYLQNQLFYITISRKTRLHFITFIAFVSIIGFSI